MCKVDLQSDALSNKLDEYWKSTIQKGNAHRVRRMNILKTVNGMFMIQLNIREKGNDIGTLWMMATHLSMCKQKGIAFAY